MDDTPKYNKLGIALSSCVIFAAVVAAQPVQTVQISEQIDARITHFTGAYGYPIEDVHSIVVEGPYRRLWLIASKADGLVFQSQGDSPYQLWRFDGNTFTSFGTPLTPQIGPRPAGEARGSISLDILKLWSGDSLLLSTTQNTYYYYDIGDGEFGKVVTSEDDREFLAISIYQGILYALTERDSSFLLWQQKQGELAPLFQVPKAEGIVAMDVNSRGLWISIGTNGIFRYDLSGKPTWVYTGAGVPAGAQSSEPGSVLSFYVMREVNETITISSVDAGILRYNATNDTFTAIAGIDTKAKRGLHIQDQVGNHMYLLGGTRYNHLFADWRSGQIIEFDTLLRIMPNVVSLYGLDLTKHFWLASTDGLHLVEWHKTANRMFLPGLSCRAITAMDTTGVLVGTDLAGSIYFVPFTQQEPAALEIIPEGFSWNRILFADPTGYWANNVQEMVHFNQAFQPDKSVLLGLSRPEAIARLPDGNLLIGNDIGILVHQVFPDGRSTRLFKNTPDQPIAQKRIHMIEPLSSRLVAVATHSGLFLVDIHEQSASLVPNTKEETILCVRKEEGQLYAGSLSGSLHAYKLDGTSLDLQSTTHIGPAIATITPDTSGHLWLGTFNGVVRYHTGTRSLLKIPGTDLAHPESNRHSAFFDRRTNQLCIGSVSGLTMLNLDDYYQLNRAGPPTVLLSSVTYFDKAQNTLVQIPISGTESTTLTLPAAHRYLSIAFHIDDLIGAGHHTYQYRLSKWGDDWFDLGTTSELTFHTLDPGRYNVEVKGQQVMGAVSQNTATVHLHVRGFFYESTWFYVCIGLLAGLGVFIWFRHNIRARRRLEREVALRTSELKADKETIEKQAQKLKDLDRLKSRFFANISHELRTPLTLILSPLKLARSKIRLNQEVIDHLDMAMQNAHVLQNRVGELLDLSKLEQGMLRVHPEETELIGFLRTTAANFDSLMTQKDIQFTFVNELPDPWHTMIDRRKMEKIIYNLLHNAIKFTPGEGSVSLCVGPFDQSIRIQVADTGRGIPAEDVEQIFERYFQTNRANAPAEGGTGIGLALVRELTHLQNGEIGVESEEGKGTCFTLVFPFERVEPAAIPTAVPVAEDDQPVHDTAKAERHVKQANGAARILVVEDHPDLRTHITQLLGGLYQVQEAPHGAAALEVLQQDTLPDLILSDVMMPEMDGFELLKNVKANRRTHTLPFCFLTAKAGMEDKIAALRLGVDDYILKPFNREELLARLHNLLAHAESRKAAALEGTEDDRPISEKDALILRIQDLTLENLDHPHFSVEFISGHCDMSRRSLHRFILEQTGLTPNNYIKEIRLTKARSLLEKREVASIAELSVQVGFQTPKYFSRIFKERFGKTPSDYL